MNLLSGYPDLILYGYLTDIKLVNLTLAIYMYTATSSANKPVVMLTSNTVSNHKSYFDMQNILSELLETIGHYPEGFRICIQLVNFKWVYPKICFSYSIGAHT